MTGFGIIRAGDDSPEGERVRLAEKRNGQRIGRYGAMAWSGPQRRSRRSPVSSIRRASDSSRSATAAA
jgi:hypothetical protein